MMNSSEQNNPRQPLISPRNILLFIFVLSTFLNIITFLVNLFSSTYFNYANYLSLLLNALVITAIIKRWRGVLKVCRILCIVSLVCVIIIIVILTSEVATTDKKVTPRSGYVLLFYIYSLALDLIIINYLKKYIKEISDHIEPEKEEPSLYQQTA